MKYINLGLFILGEALPSLWFSLAFFDHCGVWGDRVMAMIMH